MLIGRKRRCCVALLCCWCAAVAAGAPEPPVLLLEDGYMLDNTWVSRNLAASAASFGGCTTESGHGNALFFGGRVGSRNLTSAAFSLPAGTASLMVQFRLLLGSGATPGACHGPPQSVDFMLMLDGAVRETLHLTTFVRAPGTWHLVQQTWNVTGAASATLLWVQAASDAPFASPYSEMWALDDIVAIKNAAVAIRSVLDDDTGKLTILGSNFVQDFCTVNVNGAACSNVQVLNRSWLDCRTPNAGFGKANVTVRCYGNSSTITHTYTGPEIGTMTAVPTSGGNSTITGDHLYNISLHATANRSPCHVLWVSTTLVVVEIPSVRDVSKPVLVELWSAGLTARYNFNNYLPPTISSAPSRLDTTGGSLTLLGENFGGGSQQVAVTLNARPCAVTATNHTHITCIAPAGVGAQLVSVRIGVQTMLSPVRLTIYNDPKIAGILDVPTEGGVTNIWGTNFGPDSSNVVTTLLDLAGTTVGRCSGRNHTSLMCHVEQVSGAVSGPSRALKVRICTPVDCVETGMFSVNLTGPEIDCDKPGGNSTTLKISGSSFDATGLVVDVSGAACVISNHTHTYIECTTSEFCGKKTVSVRNLLGNYSCLWGFQAPVIKNLSITTLPTTGGVVVVTGEYFGGTVALAGNVSVIVDGVQYRNSATWVSARQLSATIPPGHAQGHTLLVEICGIVSGNRAHFDYEMFNVTPIAGVPTTGGEVVAHCSYIGLGDGESASVSVTISEQNCTSAAANNNNNITFWAASGAGANQQLKIAIKYANGLSGEVYSTLTYDAPVVTYLSAPSEGQTGCVLSGTNFGPEKSVRLVTFDGVLLQNRWLSHTALLLDVPAARDLDALLGNHNVVVTVAGQSFHYDFTYANPIIYSVSQVGTSGGKLLITGSSLGIPGARADVTIAGVTTCLNAICLNYTVVECDMPPGVGQGLRVTLGTLAGTSTQRSYTTRIVSVDQAFSFFLPVVGRTDPTDATLPSTGGILRVWAENVGPYPPAATLDNHVLNVHDFANSAFSIDIPAGTGKDHSIGISVSQTPTFYVPCHYAAPVVNAVANTPTTGGTIAVTGQNFGNDTSLVTVTVGGGLCILVSVSHTRVICTAPAGVGSVPLNVMVNGQSGSSGLQYTAPILVSDVRYSTLTLGGRITLYGANFGPSTSELTVYVAGKQCTALTHDHTQASCVVAEGVGETRNISMLTEYGGKSQPQEYFSYAKHIVEKIGEAPTSGQFISLDGINFGPTNTEVNVTIGGTPCENAFVAVAHTEVRCYMPAGTGAGYDVTMTIASVSTIAAAAFRYQAPTVSKATSLEYNVGGSTTIAGSNFGTDVSEIHVTVGDQTCTNVDIKQDHVALTCNLTGGKVTQQPQLVIVAVDGQTGSSNCFTYVDTHPPKCFINSTEAASSSDDYLPSDEPGRLVVYCDDAVYDLNVSTFAVKGDCVVASLTQATRTTWGVEVRALTQTSEVECSIALPAQSVHDENQLFNQFPTSAELHWKPVAHSIGESEADAAYKVALAVALPVGFVLLVLLIFLLVTCVVIAFISRRRAAAHGLHAGDEAESAAVLGSCEESYEDVFDSSASTATDLDTFPLRVSSSRLTFGLGTHQADVDSVIFEDVVLANPTTRTYTWKLFPPHSPLFHIAVEPATFTLTPKREVTVRVSLAFRCTTKLNSFAYLVATEGDSIEGETCYVQLPLTAESKLSFKLDPAELNLVHPPIGEGAYGCVYRGTWRGQEVAVKVLKNQSTLGEEEIKEFTDEVHMMETLRIPQVVEFFGAVSFMPHMAIVTEFMPLGNVTSAMEKTKFSLVLKLKCLLNCSQGMAFLHSSSIMHRDLKADNLLMVSLDADVPVNCKLADFGTTRDVSNTSSKLTKGIGTPIYMSPEALEGSSYSFSSDVFSFAILCYHVFTEQMPYADINTAWGVSEFVTSGKRLPIPAGTPESLRYIITRCWAQAPKDRMKFSEVTGFLEAAITSERAHSRSANS
eukprot:TRINITY_DN1417_c0_g1_i1.p1 TRINITY_DN1417_c0_g1~~TRINITY_DN1417_c0_g1_i1.p1  ORF type:complete len:1967 (+),score=307.88 TRINITY_DN1417_c0_g1_i1:76-5976(+)